LGMFERHFVDN